MRTPLLITLAATGALVLTGCGGDGSTDAAPAPAPSPTASGTPATGAPALALDGGWLGESDVDQVAMVVEGGTVRLASQGPDGGQRQACEGLLKEGSLLLQCTDRKNTTRTRGTVEISDGEKIAVAWESGRKDLLTRSADGRIDLSQWGL
ncbi:hypothetical protein AB0O01_34120 [Streptomyces sp. NPDC093252]|uniref:hypothetical protein n=1 Tax=Streptomyces sp. NPDC093252 TaxID=3154980 RepID=UPI003435354F